MSRLSHHRSISARLAFIAIFAVVATLVSTSVTHAASLYISPSAPKVTVGNIISVRVLVSTDGKPVNNAEGSIQFPIDLLNVQSISKSSSIFSLWVEEPKFSNLGGSISFNGGVPNPGFTGNSGEVVTITFLAKKTGTASVVFSDAAVRQNDGLGTDILSAKIPAMITVESSGQVELAPPVVVSGAPKAPVVTSKSHPQSNRWYNTSDVELDWNVPNDVTAVSTLLSKGAVSDPTVVYDPPIGNKKITKLDDGIWYFHVKFKNKNGWGATTHFKIQIDTVPPEAFKITFPHGSSTDDPRPIAYFNTKDALSGVDFYQVKIGESQFMRISTQDVASNPYSPPPQDPGTHDILVKAVDLAGNETVQASEFTVSSINVPKIEDYPTEIDEGDLLRIRGVSYPSITVEIVMQDSSGQKSSEIVNTLVNGEFSLVWPKELKKGVYSFSVRAVDPRGAKSEFSKPEKFTVRISSLTNVGSLVLNWLSILVIGVLAICGIVLIILYFFHRARVMKRSANRRIRSVESSIHRAFDLLRDNVREQIKTLEKAKTKRNLTKEEEKVIKQLQENLTKSEQYLEKQIEDIEETIS